MSLRALETESALTVEDTPAPGFNYVRFARRTLRERWWIILGMFLLIMIPGGALVYSTSAKLYEASATLFFEGPKSENPLLRGIVSLDDLIRVLAAELGQLAEALRWGRMRERSRRRG